MLNTMFTFFDDEDEDGWMEDCIFLLLFKLSHKNF